MKLLHILCVIGFTGSMIWFAEPILSYGDGVVTIFGMCLLVVLFDFNTEIPDSLNDKIESFGQLMRIIFGSAVMLFAIAAFTTWVLSIYLAYGFLSYYFVKSVSRFLFWPFIKPSKETS